MKYYFDIINGNYYNETEIRQSYEEYKDELPDESYEDHLDRQLMLGREKIEGLVEIPESIEAKAIIESGRYSEAIALMDDEIREKIHDDLSPCSDEDFLTVYMYAHCEKFEEEFAI